MNGHVTRLAWSMLALVALLVGNLQYQQLTGGGRDLDAEPGNRRALVERFSSERGLVVLGEEALARSVRSGDPEAELEYERAYPLGSRAAHVVGWSSTVVGTSGIERAYDDQLTPGGSDVLAANLAQLLGGGDAVGDTVRLTLEPTVQAAAERALAGREGAVIALDPLTGEILAHASSPTFDPGPLADQDRGAALEAWDAYRNDPAAPLLDRAVRELYPPGSVFKLVVAAAALEAGISPATSFPDIASYRPNVGQPIANFGGSTCTGGGSLDLATALAVSCNTVFARLAVELGRDDLAEQARRFGFDRDLPYELPVATSRFPAETDDATLAQSGIGQFDVRTTALQMAVVVQAIVNDGVLLRPHVVRDVRDDSAALVAGPRDGPWTGDGFAAEAVSEHTAEQLRELMVRVVEQGTGARAAIPGIVVGGKTGTAQDPARDSATAWFVGFADDRVAVAVVLPDAGGEGGGAVAAPVARAVMEAALAARP
jgi:peptidoglycan glycosyltransferase